MDLRPLLLRRNGISNARQTHRRPILPWPVTILPIPVADCIRQDRLKLDAIATDGIGLLGDAKAARMVAVFESKAKPLDTLVTYFGPLPFVPPGNRPRRKGDLDRRTRLRKIDGGGRDPVFENTNSPRHLLPYEGNGRRR